MVDSEETPKMSLSAYQKYDLFMYGEQSQTHKLVGPEATSSDSPLSDLNEAIDSIKSLNWCQRIDMIMFGQSSNTYEARLDVMELHSNDMPEMGLSVYQKYDLFMYGERSQTHKLVCPEAVTSDSPLSDLNEAIDYIRSINWCQRIDMIIFG